MRDERTVDNSTIECRMVYMDKPTARQLASRRRLDEAGENLRAARENLQTAMEAARKAALDTIAVNGTPESVVAQALGVDRMTVRKWVGKR